MDMSERGALGLELFQPGAGSAALMSVADKGRMAAEMSAAKNLIAAWQAATADNNGRLLPAFDKSAPAVSNAGGKPVSNAEARKRYPWRLAPYFSYAIKGTLLVGDNERQFMHDMEIPSPQDSQYDYGVSVFPALGINRHFVGGVAGAPDPGGECIRTMASADHSVIVFVSAGIEGVDGYEYVVAPGAPGANWSAAPWTDKSDPGDYGHVHPRHDGRAVAAFLDGSVRLLGLDELRDMRLWSRNAAIQDNPGYKAQN